MQNRTLTAIIDGFNRLICEHDFQKISVDMILQEAAVTETSLPLMRTMLKYLY